MNKFTLSFAAILTIASATHPVLAAVNGGFGLDAFNRAVSASTSCNAVFSPISFEIDCVVMSEAFGALTRANFAEKMGVLNGLEQVYQPIYERLIAGGEKGLSFLSARGFCLPDERKSHSAYRAWMQRTFGAEAFSQVFKEGAERWFQSRLEGDFDDFEIPFGAISEKGYSYYDLVSVNVAWAEPFPTNLTRSIDFALESETNTSVMAMCDMRLVDVWERNNLTVIRLPLVDSSWFYALLPKPGNRIRDIRGELSSKTLLDLVTGFKSLTESGISHGPAVIALPTMDITFQSNLAQPFTYFGFPVSGMERIDGTFTPREIKQWTRFKLAENGQSQQPLPEKTIDQTAAKSPDTKRLVFNRPFLFFVYHEPTSTIPIVGQYSGR